MATRSPRASPMGRVVTRLRYPMRATHGVKLALVDQVVRIDRSFEAPRCTLPEVRFSLRQIQHTLRRVWTTFRKAWATFRNAWATLPKDRTTLPMVRTALRAVRFAPSVA